MKYVISYFPEKETTFVLADYGVQFLQNSNTPHLFVKTHERYDDSAMKCVCGGSWNARTEDGIAVHFCNHERITLMRKESRMID